LAGLLLELDHVLVVDATAERTLPNHGRGNPDCITGDGITDFANRLVGPNTLASHAKAGSFMSGPRLICYLLVIAATLISFSGCDQFDSPANYIALQGPEAEHPVVNPPLAIRKENWLGGPGRNEGSCVHASLTNMLRWQNQFGLEQAWRKKYSGGEYDSRLRERLADANIPFAFTGNSSLEFLDAAHRSRRGALLWWKPSHCCTFCGWVKDRDGKVYAVILDNNNVRSYELTERSQFQRLWAGYGGFALSTLYDPASVPIWKSYARKTNEIDF
jgi:hypothetical protein